MLHSGRAQHSSLNGELVFSGLEIQQRSAAPQIKRRRHLVVNDEPGAVDLSKACCGAQPAFGPVPVRHRAADPNEVVPKSHVIAHGDREVANFVAEQALVIEKAGSQFFLFASAPTCCSGGSMSNDTMSGA